jgi:GNAT superfamily N-acetyltransferase
MPPVTIRSLAPDVPLDEITGLVRRAFARLGAVGLNCTSVNQPVVVTRQRIAAGSCLVAEWNRQLAGTLTVYPPGNDAEVPWYQIRDVASVHQFAVEPRLHGMGIGVSLLMAAEQWALARGYGEIALDTPEPARHLIAYYLRRGFRQVGSVCLAGRNYRSTILGKPVERRPQGASH